MHNSYCSALQENERLLTTGCKWQNALKVLLHAVCQTANFSAISLPNVIQFSCAWCSAKDEIHRHWLWWTLLFLESQLLVQRTCWTWIDIFSQQHALWMLPLLIACQMRKTVPNSKTNTTSCTGVKDAQCGQHSQCTRVLKHLSVSVESNTFLNSKLA